MVTSEQVVCTGFGFWVRVSHLQQPKKPKKSMFFSDISSRSLYRPSPKHEISLTIFSEIFIHGQIRLLILFFLQQAFFLQVPQSFWKSNLGISHYSYLIFQPPSRIYLLPRSTETTLHRNRETTIHKNQIHRNLFSFSQD